MENNLFSCLIAKFKNKEKEKKNIKQGISSDFDETFYGKYFKLILTRRKTVFWRWKKLLALLARVRTPTFTSLIKTNRWRETFSIRNSSSIAI